MEPVDGYRVAVHHFKEVVPRDVAAVSDVAVKAASRFEGRRIAGSCRMPHIPVPTAGMLRSGWLELPRSACLLLPAGTHDPRCAYKHTLQAMSLRYRERRC